MLGVGLLMLFSIASSTNPPVVEADCDFFSDCEKFGDTGKGYCRATCSTEQKNEQFLCLCKQDAAEDDTAITCENCSVQNVTGNLDLERCKTICSDVSGCNAFAYTDKDPQHQDEAQCSLWKKCIEPIISQGDQTTYKKCDIPGPGELCPQLTPRYGPTVLHWTCKDQSNDDISPYYDEDKEKLVEDIKCAPLPSGISCESDSVVDSGTFPGTASLECTDNGGTMEWQLKDPSTPPELNNQNSFDIECKCPKQNVKAGFGTELVCNQNVNPSDGKYTLEDPNTCILLCDGIFVASITCEIGENGDGDAKEIHWIYTYEELDGTIVEIVQDPVNSKCISCFQSDLDEDCEEEQNPMLKRRDS